MYACVNVNTSNSISTVNNTYTRLTFCNTLTRLDITSYSSYNGQTWPEYELQLFLSIHSKIFFGNCLYMNKIYDEKRMYPLDMIQNVDVSYIYLVSTTYLQHSHQILEPPGPSPSPVDSIFKINMKVWNIGYASPF